MLGGTRGIVLRTRNYSDQSLICTIYTQKYGTKGFMVKGKKNIPKLGCFQPGNILDMIYHIGKSDLYILDKFFVEHANHSARKNINTAWLFLFTLEFIENVFTTPEQDLELYRFLEAETKRFSKDDKRCRQIHLEVMRDLMGYLGIKPLLPSTFQDNFFEIASGTFIATDRLGTLDLKKSCIFLDFLKDSYKNTPDRKILDADSREILLPILMNYYMTHLEGFRVPKSYEQIREMFFLQKCV